MPGIGLLDNLPNEGNISQEAGLLGLLQLLSAYALFQQARMLAIQQRAFPSFGGQTQGLPITSGVVPSFPGRMVRFPIDQRVQFQAADPGLMEKIWEVISRSSRRSALMGGNQPLGPVPSGVAQRLPQLPSFDPQKLLAIQEGASPQFSMDRFLPGARFARFPEALRLKEIPEALHPLLREEARQFEQNLLEAVTRESRDPRHLPNLIQALMRQ